MLSEIRFNMPSLLLNNSAQMFASLTNAPVNKQLLVFAKLILNETEVSVQKKTKTKLKVKNQN